MINNSVSWNFDLQCSLKTQANKNISRNKINILICK